MSIARYQPWNTFSHFQTDPFNNELSQFFNKHREAKNDSKTHPQTHPWTPAVDIKETETAFELHADIPGVNPKDIDVQMEKGVLTVKGAREISKKDEADGYTRLERYSGEFVRRFSLPETANADKINAKYNDGVLSITIPKQETLQPRKIEVEH